MKKSRKLFIFLFSILFLNLNYAQDTQDLGFCGTKQEPLLTPISIRDIEKSRYSTTNEQIVLSVKIHFISNNIPVNEQELKALDAVAALNLSFNSGNIFFKYMGYDNIDNDDFLVVDISDTNDMLNYCSDWIDIFVVDAIGSEGAIGQSYGFINANGISAKMIFIKKTVLPTVNTDTPTNSDLKQNVLSHEIGHYLGLYHTHQRWKYNSDGVLTTLSDNYIDCEITNFEENLDNTEWDIYGDLIEDTNPDRILRYYSNNYYYLNCESIVINELHTHCGNTLDVNLFNPPLTNIMSYHHLCTNTFTQGQYNYMRAYIELNRQGFLANEFNTVESLYEPYETAEEPAVSCIIYLAVAEVGDPIYWLDRKHFGNKFQKGFDYNFYTWNIDNDTFNYVSSAQVHENYLYDFGSAAVEIQQLGDAIMVFDERQLRIPGPIIQYTTVISSDVNYNNPTTKELDTEESYASDFYENLENEKLHIIIKHLSNGENDTKVIYKTQN